MAYFANGTEGMMYQEKWCFRCKHEEDCAVWMAHLLYCYDVRENEQAIAILDELIPEDGNTVGQCRMFLEAKEQS